MKAINKSSYLVKVIGPNFLSKIKKKKKIQKKFIFGKIVVGKIEKSGYI